MNAIIALGGSVRKFWMSITVCVFILVLCFMKMDNMPQAPMTHFDKLVHTLLFFGLSGVVFFDNTRYLRQSTPLQRIFFGSFLFPVFFGGMIEVLQGYAHRSGDWMDFLFDAIGVVAGILICWLINTRLKSPTDG